MKLRRSSHVLATTTCGLALCLWPTVSRAQPSSQETEVGLTTGSRSRFASRRGVIPGRWRRPRRRRCCTSAASAAERGPPRQRAGCGRRAAVRRRRDATGRQGRWGWDAERPDRVERHVGALRHRRDARACDPGRRVAVDHVGSGDRYTGRARPPHLTTPPRSRCVVGRTVGLPGERHMTRRHEVEAPMRGGWPP
jgi:hypothetical protein